jgi:hypothetical protein
MFSNKVIFLFLVFFSLNFTNLAISETISFGSSVYEGEVKKGKAHGEGILTFSDDTTYKGNFKRNKPHGKGIYTDPREISYEGKWRNGKLKVKLDKKTRRVIKLSVEEGQTNFFEIKGTGQLISKWFEAEINTEGNFVLSKKGKRDFESAKKQAENDSGSGGSGGSS